MLAPDEAAPKRWKRVASYWLPVVFGVLVSLSIYFTGGLDGIENMLHDAEARLTRQQLPSDVVLVEIDSQSLKTLNHWPWPRQYYAKVIDALVAAGARDLFIDIDFSSASDLYNDKRLAKSFANAGIPVYVPTFLQHTNYDRNPVISLSQPDDVFARHVRTVSVNLTPDQDGLVRRYVLQSRFAGEKLRTYAAELNGLDETIQDRDIRLNYRISPYSFERLSFLSVYNGKADLSMLRDKHIIIGSTALELGDTIPVPVYRSLPGSVVQALAYQSVAIGVIHEAGPEIVVMLMLLTALVSGIWISRPDWRTGLARYCALIVSILLVSIVLHGVFNVIIEILPLLLMASLSFVVTQLLRLDRKIYTVIRQKALLRRRELLMSSVVEHTSEGIFTLDHNLNILSINRAARAMFAIDDGYLNTPINNLIPDIASAVKNYSASNNYTHHECLARSMSGREFYIEYVLDALPDAIDGNYTLFIRDASVNRRHRDALEYQANYDLLTGVRNRNSLLDIMQSYIESSGADAQKIVLLLMNINDMHSINNSLGRKTGDDVLKRVADRLTKIECENVVVGRVGGDEFAVFCTQTHINAVIDRHINDIINLLKQPIIISEMSLTTSVAIGVAVMPEHTVSADKLLISADVAMHEAKNMNKTYVVYEASFDQHTKFNLRISNDLKKAVSSHQFEFYYQPKIEMAQDRLVGFEALIRWHHPELGLIMPNNFIRIAENSSIITPITLLSVDQAARQVKALAHQGIQVPVAINLSVKVLSESLVDDICANLRQHDIAPSMLELEITESASIENHKNALRVLKLFRERGFRLAIDDFGTENASVSYLKKLPVNELKIDRLFISDVCSNRQDQLITSSIIALAHGLGMKVVAEGIENEETYNYLRSAGCDVAQGYWMGRPMPASDIAAWYVDWTGPASPRVTAAST